MGRLTLSAHPGVVPLFTRKEAAARLHVSEATLIRLARAGLITEIRVGERAVRISPDVIDDYLAARQIPAGMTA